MPLIAKPKNPQGSPASESAAKPQPTPQRDAKGGWLPGISGNPAGRPPGIPNTWVPFKVRAAQLLEKYGFKDVKRIATSEAELEQLSSYDAMILMRMATAMTAKGGKDFFKMIEFIDGKPIATTEITGKNGAPINWIERPLDYVGDETGVSDEG